MNLLFLFLFIASWTWEVVSVLYHCVLRVSLCELPVMLMRLKRDVMYSIALGLRCFKWKLLELPMVSSWFPTTRISLEEVCLPFYI